MRGCFTSTGNAARSIHSGWNNPEVLKTRIGTKPQQTTHTPCTVCIYRWLSARLQYLQCVSTKPSICFVCDVQDTFYICLSNAILYVSSTKLTTQQYDKYFHQIFMYCLVDPYGNYLWMLAWQSAVNKPILSSTIFVISTVHDFNLQTNLVPSQGTQWYILTVT